MQCSTCGRFMVIEPGCAIKMLYSGYPPTPDRELFRCRACVDKYGGFTPQHGIKPEYSAWVVKKDDHP